MLFSTSQDELFLIIDVQSSIVRGTLVQVRPSALPLVLFTHNVEIPYKTHAHSDYLIKMAMKAVSETLDQAARHVHTRSALEPIPKKISSIHYVLSSPWIVSQAKTLSLSFTEDTPISRAYIMGMIWEERKKMSASSEDVSVIEEKVFDVRLNGYSVSSWESRRTRLLDVSFVVSVAGTRMIDKFVHACDHLVHKQKVFFHSSLFLQHIGIEKIIPDSSTYALIHIHGELTDIAIIHAQSCTFFGSYPFGIHSIVRTIARETKINDTSADSLLSMATQGQLDVAHATKELSIIDDMNKGWIGEFRKLLKTSSALGSLPHHIIISAHSHEDFFLNSFKQAYPESFLELLSIDRILPLVAFDVHADRVRLTGLYVIAIHTLYK